MQQDYQGNAKKDRTKKEVPEKDIQKVVAGEVIVKKKGIGRKFKDLFIEADFRSVVRYIASDVLLPAARNMIVDGFTKGVERMMYGESVHRRTFGSGPRYSYNNPINRNPREMSTRYAPPQRIGAGTSKQVREDLILTSREEAELVLERMNDIIESYEVVSVVDLNELVGLPSTHIDNKWGWLFLGDANIRQIREGYLLELPPAEPIQ